MFGPQAGVYAASKVHISDDSLESVQKLTGPNFRRGTTPYGWAVDIGTGAGFTAFAMAEVSDRVVASDITQPMLRQARRISGERGCTTCGWHRMRPSHYPSATAVLT